MEIESSIPDTKVTLWFTLLDDKDSSTCHIDLVFVDLALVLFVLCVFMCVFVCVCYCMFCLWVKVKVEFLDYGNSETTEASGLKRLPAKGRTFPFQGVTCSLRGKG